MLKVRICGITKSYTPDQPVLKPIHLAVEAGERFFLLGPSGCGKSTLLRILAGLLTPSTGSVFFNDMDVTDLAPEQRKAPMVFQNYALWPNMTVAENVAFGLRAARKYDRAAIRQRTEAALATVQMTAFAGRRPGALSGGQQQRVALARCLAIDPQLLLLDEPLSNLDARLRDRMRLELLHVCRERQLTAIYVTHDRREALSMADRAAVLHDGVLQQVDTPIALYRRPANRFVASFLGDANLLDAVFEGGNKVRVEALHAVFTLAEVPIAVKPGSRVTLFCRPEAVRFGEAPENSFRCRLQEGQFMGEAFHWTFAGGLTVTEPAAPERQTGRDYALSVEPGQLRILTE